MWRGLLVLAAMLLMSVPAIGAPVFSTPSALLSYIYGGYSTGKFPDDNGIFYSKKLNAEFAKANAATPADDVGPIDFDVFTNAQDYQITDLNIGDATVDGQGMKVPVSLKNFGEAQSFLFHLVKEGEGWKIDDIDCLTAGNQWTLSSLLAAPPDSDSTAGSGDAD